MKEIDQYALDHDSEELFALPPLALLFRAKYCSHFFSYRRWLLTEEGESYAQNGSPEAIVYNAVPDEGEQQKSLVDRLGQVGKVGFGAAMKNKWISVDKAAGQLVKKAVDSIEDKVQLDLKAIKVGFLALSLIVWSGYAALSAGWSLGGYSVGADSTSSQKEKVCVTHALSVINRL